MTACRFVFSIFEGVDMQRGNVSRRGFLRRSFWALTAGAGLPAWYARELIAADEDKAAAAKKTAANDRVVLGAVGIGSPASRGLAITDEARGKGAVVAAVCDVDRRHRERAAKRYGPDCTAYADFRELLDRPDISAVTIAVPDQWHALIALYAMKKGKDVYGEKPLALTIAEGQALVKGARATGRVYQVGSQQRSDDRFRLACELVRNGRIGKVQTVETRIGENPKSPPIPAVSPPPELDWDFWLGPAPRVDYAELREGNHTYTRCHYEFRWWYEYSGGKMTDWGAHHNDISQWGLGMDESGPVAVEGTGVPPPPEPNSYNCHPEFTAVFTYANGAKVVCTGRGENGIKFIGDGGKWIFVNRERIQASDPKLLDEPLPSGATRLYASRDHMGNFFDCLRSRKRPICDVEIGHRSVTVCHLGNIAIRTGKKFRWDPARERADDAGVNEWLSRPMRAPWDKLWSEMTA
jgi:predicted dehydrogenase